MTLGPTSGHDTILTSAQQFLSASSVMTGKLRGKTLEAISAGKFLSFEREQCVPEDLLSMGAEIVETIFIFPTLSRILVVFV